MEDLSKLTTVQLITEMTYLDQEIDMKLLRYEELRGEIIKRFPQVAEREEFKKKVKKYGGETDKALFRKIQKQNE